MAVLDKGMAALMRRSEERREGRPRTNGRPATKEASHVAMAGLVSRREGTL
ncbi:hypothetical protein M529_02120 [Sphingobium ummariense RL-3]|uniref:Uncharacterized protein n=1 Tax=Sphingobium ummariense RL-3 TaxID=1346791 RepID=T0KKI4_9SPHN|nr:hypothetical protein M529_02120 [Sphingobium ummariense RL-3]